VRREWKDGQLTPRAGMATAQSCAIFFSLGMTTASDVGVSGSIGWPVPTHIKSVEVRYVRWKMNEGELGSGEGMEVLYSLIWTSSSAIA